MNIMVFKLIWPIFCLWLVFVSLVLCMEPEAVLRDRARSLERDFQVLKRLCFQEGERGQSLGYEWLRQ